MEISVNLLKIKVKGKKKRKRDIHFHQSNRKLIYTAAGVYRATLINSYRKYKEYNK